MWPFKKKEAEPYDMLVEQFDLIVKAARRCAYDLKHAADDIDDREAGKMYADRAAMWLTMFNPANGPKDYHSKLRLEIERLQRDIRVVKEAAKKNGVDIDYIDFWGDHED